MDRTVDRTQRAGGDEEAGYLRRSDVDRDEVENPVADEPHVGFVGDRASVVSDDSVMFVVVGRGARELGPLTAVIARRTPENGAATVDHDDGEPRRCRHRERVRDAAVLETVERVRQCDAARRLRVLAE